MLLQLPKISFLASFIPHNYAIYTRISPIWLRNIFTEYPFPELKRTHSRESGRADHADYLA